MGSSTRENIGKIGLSSYKVLLFRNSIFTVVNILEFIDFSINFAVFL
jgi:hypothetical protein